EDDPLVGWVLPNDATRAKRWTAIMDAMLRRAIKRDAYETYATGDGAACAMWGRPGAWDVPASVMLPAAPRMLRNLGLGGVARLNIAMAALKKAHPHEEHWYLAGIGTDPPAQGTGLGGALVRQMLERCDRERVPSYLETQKERNVPWYEKFGYRVTGEIDLPKGGPHLWLMWRDPQ
ncbi:MAG: GNAT family N-acetyltransferase, partial [Candidatus Binatia bacterium]